MGIPSNKKTFRLWDVVIVPSALILLGGLIYSNTFFSPFHFDDHFTILENPFIKSPGKIKLLLMFDPSRFLTHASFAINYHLGGIKTFGYHVVNFILHLVTSYAVYAFLKITCEIAAEKGMLPSRGGRFVAGFAALIFLCHPLQTQAVTYVSQRSTLLATLCYLSALIFYVLYRREKRRHYYTASFLFAFVGIFTKPIIVTLPLAILLYEIFFLDFSFKKPQGRIKALIPFFLLALLVPFLLMQWRYRSIDISRFYEMTRETVRYTRMEYFLTQLNVGVTYLRLLFFPVNQTLDYDYPVARSLFAFPTGISAALLTGVFGLAVYLYRRKRIISFGILWMFLTLSLESSFFPIADLINEHRLYLPMVGFAFSMAFFIYESIPHRVLRNFVFLSVLLTLSVLTYARNWVWADELRFLEDMAHKAPQKARIHHNMGNVYLDRGDFGKAEAQFKKAIELRPDFVYAHNNLGAVYQAMGKKDLAAKAYQKALELNPRSCEAYFNLGNLAWDDGKGDVEKAGQYYLKALGVNPYFAPAIVALGKLHLAYLDLPLAEFYFRLGINVDPGYTYGYCGLGELYTLRRDYGKAFLSYQQALKCDPHIVVAYINIGNILDMRGQTLGAIAEYKKAIALDSQNARAYFNLANSLGKQGDAGAAKKYYDAALGIFEKEGNTEMTRAVRQRLQNFP